MTVLRAAPNPLVYVPVIPSPIAALWPAGYRVGTIRITDVPGGRPVAEVQHRPRDIFDMVSTARTAPGATFYVNVSTGSDSNNGLTSGTAFQSIFKAIQAANTAGVPTLIYVAAGAYNRTFNPSVSSTAPTVDVAIVATGGRVNTGTWDNPSSPVDDGSGTSTYSWAVANCEKVAATDQRTNDGFYVEMTKVTTQAQVQKTPGSWALVAGTLYVHRIDGTAPSSSNCRVFRTTVNTFRLTTSVNVFIGGDDAQSGFDCEGGTSAVLSVNLAADPGSDKVLAVENSTFRYAAGASTARGVSTETWRGLAYFYNCASDANGSDGFNNHNANGAPSNSCLLITVNCQGVDNGRPGFTSCNGWTGHENVVMIDIAGRYERNHGGSVRNIGTSKAWLVGTVIIGDLGDIVLGGSLVATALELDDSAEAWVDHIKPIMPPGRYGIVATATSKVHKRNCDPTIQADHAQPGATIDTY